MSDWYSLDIILKVPFTEKNILKVLEKGSLLGVTYLDHVMFERYEKSPELDALGALNKIIISHNMPINEDDTSSVYTKIDNAYGLLMFTESQYNLLTVSFSLTTNIKKRHFEAGDYIDLAFYNRFLLDLCNDFPISEIKTEII